MMKRPMLSLVATLTLALFALNSWAAVLVGNDGSLWATTEEGVQDSGGNAFWHEPEPGEGYVATTSGTAATAHIRIATSGWVTATSLKIVVYSSTRVKLAESAVISSAGGVGNRSAAISVSITSGQTYFLAVIPNSGYIDVVTLTGSSFQTNGGNVLSYATPDDPLPTASNNSRPQFAVWLENVSSTGMIKKRRRH
jgi:hypothetical protein